MSRIPPSGPSPYTFANATNLAMQALERLATGNAINRGADGPAALIASENFAARLSSNQAEINSIARNEAFLNVRSGALGAQLDNLSDLDALSVQAANTAGNTTDELGAIVTQAISHRTHLSTSFSIPPFFSGFSKLFFFAELPA